MWRVVCVGPSPRDRIRRVVDRGPLHQQKSRAEAYAGFLRATGLYETVTVEDCAAVVSVSSGSPAAGLPGPAAPAGNSRA